MLIQGFFEEPGTIAGNSEDNGDIEDDGIKPVHIVDDVDADNIENNEDVENNGKNNKKINSLFRCYQCHRTPENSCNEVIDVIETCRKAEPPPRSFRNRFEVGFYKK